MLFKCNHAADYRRVKKPNDRPTYSPDLNVIEPIWDQLDRRIRARVNPPQTVHQLETALIEEWNNIPQQNIQRLFGSMRRRLRAVIVARGGNTIY